MPEKTEKTRGKTGGKPNLPSSDSATRLFHVLPGSPTEIDQSSLTYMAIGDAACDRQYRIREVPNPLQRHRRNYGWLQNLVSRKMKIAQKTPASSKAIFEQNQAGLGPIRAAEIQLFRSSILAVPNEIPKSKRHRPKVMKALVRTPILVNDCLAVAH